MEWIVTRHEAAVRWLKARYPKGSVSPELPSIDFLSKGDLVVGNLPLFLVHKLNQKGVEVEIISMEVPLEMRGKELTDEEFLSCNPQVMPFVVLQTSLCEYGELLTELNGRRYIDPTKFV